MWMELGNVFSIHHALVKGDKQIKLTALIKSRDLRSEGINIKTYIKNKKNELSEDLVLSRKIEDLILTKARVLRIQNKLK